VSKSPDQPEIAESLRLTEQNVKNEPKGGSNVGDERFTHRFSPRKASSTWSRINVQRATPLIEAGLMAEPGLRALQAREEERTAVYTYEQETPGLSSADNKRFMKNGKACLRINRRVTNDLPVLGGKGETREETRQRRFAKLMKDSENGRRLDNVSPKIRRQSAK
jgi:hypothetical protein